MATTADFLVDQVLKQAIDTVTGQAKSGGYQSRVVRVPLSGGRTRIVFPENWLIITGTNKQSKNGPSFGTS